MGEPASFVKLFNRVVRGKTPKTKKNTRRNTQINHTQKENISKCKSENQPTVAKSGKGSNQEAFRDTARG